MKILKAIASFLTGKDMTVIRAEDNPRCDEVVTLMVITDKKEEALTEEQKAFLTEVKDYEEIIKGSTHTAIGRAFYSDDD